MATNGDSGSEDPSAFLAVERAFHDDYAKRLDWSAHVGDKLSYEHEYYDEAEEYLRRLLGDVSGKALLDIGSGHGNCALALAKRDAVVTSVDISPELVRGCRRRAELNGLNADFRVMNACVLDFPTASFDIVVAARSVHHLPDVGAFYREAHRVLKPAGVLLLLEPQKFNPFVEFGRTFIKRGPEWRTTTEHPLVPRDLRLIKTVFGNVETKEFEFLGSACHALGLLGLPRAREAAAALARPLDHLLRLIPWLRPLYWQVVVRAQKTIKTDPLPLTP